jgi:hypothetical protein
MSESFMKGEHITLTTEDGDQLPPAHLCIYPSLRLMRDAARKFNDVDGKDALGFTQKAAGIPVIRLAESCLSMRIIVHECAHAALILRESFEANSFAHAFDEDSDQWGDETFCHIMDDLTCEVLDWILNNTTMCAIPLDHTMLGNE